VVSQRNKMSTTDTIIEECATGSSSRSDFWIKFIKNQGFTKIAEIGVYKGEFAAEILRGCDSISTYHMIDPWRNLVNWNKPANTDDQTFQNFYKKMLGKTDFAKEKRSIMRGTTTEVIHEISDETLDFAYIDGDHTLRGITIDLINVYPKIKNGGWIGGDDFCKSIWQHPPNYEPTLVFPFALYFAESVSARIFGLPYNQFLIEKKPSSYYKFVDLTGEYKDMGLHNQFTQKGDSLDRINIAIPPLERLKRLLTSLISRII
jgi:hypothetical protein